jgi:hypothetical protein
MMLRPGIQEMGIAEASARLTTEAGSRAISCQNQFAVLAKEANMHGVNRFLLIFAVV